MQKIKKILIQVNKINQRQWFIFSLLTTTCGVWFSLILNFWGTSLFLLTISESGERTFTPIGLILTILTVGWTFLSSIAQRYCDYINKTLAITESDLGNTETLYEIVGASVVSICEDVVLEKIKFVDKALKNPDEIVLPAINPCLQLKKINSEIVSVTSKLLSIKNYNVKEKDLCVDIFYKFPLYKDKWYKADSSKQEKGLKTYELTNQNTTFYEALHNPLKFVYYNNKNDAALAGRYLPDDQDVIKDGKIVGSIACFKFEVTHDGKDYIEFVVSLASYGKTFSKTNDKTVNENISYNFRKNIMNEYEYLIKSALCDFYICQIKNSYDKQKVTSETQCKPCIPENLTL